MSYSQKFHQFHSYEEYGDQALDTGAQCCLFGRSWADRIAIDVEAGPRRTFLGLAGRFEAHEHEITVATFGIQFTSTVYFARDAGVARDLLGRNGWLDRFRIAINHYDRELYPSPYNE